MSPLIVASTPIGNVGDATDRLRQAITEADLIAAEDSRKLHRLASDLKVPFRAKIISFFEGNESERLASLIADIESGKRVLLITDAGTPGVSDPGYRLIHETIERELPLTVIPGASAVLTALTYSGLPCESFAFDGFLPRGERALEQYFASIRLERRTVVAFDSPKRISDSLIVAARMLGGERKVAICREMTKTFEEIFRGDLEGAIEWSRLRQEGDGIKGEITMVIAPMTGKREFSEAELERRAGELHDLGYSTKDLASIIALEFSISKRQAYDLSNSLRDSNR